VSEPPFEIHNAGYGSFPIYITIFFHDPYERPLEYTHSLKIFPDEDPDTQKVQKKTAPVIYENYNEVTFFEPTEQFYAVLSQNTYEVYKNKYYESLGQNQDPSATGSVTRKVEEPLLAHQQSSSVQQQQMNEQVQVIQERIQKYENYLTKHSLKPIIRSQFKELLKQMKDYKI